MPSTPARRTRSCSSAVRLIRGARRPQDGFLPARGEPVTAATYLEELKDDLGLGGYLLAPDGGRSLHEQSHGESFLAVMVNRFGPDGLYLLDEPEAALSTQNCLTALRRIHELVRDRSQLIIATHSPIILAYPDARIYHCNERGLEPVDYEDAEPVRLTQSFLEARERFLHELMREKAAIGSPGHGTDAERGEAMEATSDVPRRRCSGTTARR